MKLLFLLTQIAYSVGLFDESAKTYTSIVFMETRLKLCKDVLAHIEKSPFAVQHVLRLKLKTTKG